MIVIDGETLLTDIRVGISDTAMTSMDLGKIDILSKDGFTLTDKIAVRSFEIEPDAAVSFTVDTAAGAVNVLKAGTFLCSTANRLYAVPVSEESKLQITSIRRGYGYPGYRGFFEISISKTAPDKLRLINELSMEKYLYQVVPSEMPASFGLEALKAQAVAARTYAINECFSNAALANQGISVYDSVLSQVYNNSAENLLTNQAVNETAGMTPGLRSLVYRTNIDIIKLISTRQIPVKGERGYSAYLPDSSFIIGYRLIICLQTTLSAR